MALQEDEENMNANNIQDVMGEVEETAEVEGTIGPANLNESREVDEEEKPEGRKKTVIKSVVDKKYQPSVLDKSISRLQDQLNKHFDTTKKTEDSLKQIERKMSQIDKIVIVSNKQHEIIRKIQVQFNDIQRTLTKIDKSNTSLRSRSAPKSKPSVKVDKKKIHKSKNSKKRGLGKNKVSQARK
jgi:hypothetical protein